MTPPPPDPTPALAQARALLAEGRLRMAARIAQRVLAAAPGHGGAHDVLGQVAFRTGRYDDAVAAFTRVAAARPDDPQAQCTLAASHAARGAFDEAERAYARAIALRSDHEPALAGRADVLLRRGDADAAAALLDPLLASGRATALSAVVRARLARGRDDHATIVRLVETFVDRHDTAPPQRRALLRLLGQAREAEGAYDGAFAAYREANAVGRVPYDAAKTTWKFDRLKEAFAPKGWTDLPRATRGDALPVFVVGLPRCGSTLVEQIIDAHPVAHGAGEIPDLAHLLRDMPKVVGAERPYPFCVPGLTTDDLDALAARHVERLRAYDARAERIVDKSLENYERLGIIGMLFPEASVIHVRRDPMDLCLSCYLHGLDPRLHPYASRLEDLGAHHRRYEDLMAFWRTLDGIRLLEVDYETLVTDQESASRAIIDFVGLDWDDRCLRFHETKRHVATLSFDQVRRPMYRTAVGRWHRYEHHLEPLAAALRGDPPGPV